VGTLSVDPLANASGKTVAEIAALREAGKGWGQIARNRGLSTGNGSIRNGDHGKGKTRDLP
jgi:hypothetical protein